MPLFLRVQNVVEITGTLKHQKVALRNQGVDPASVGEDHMWWLEPGSDEYKPFKEKDWQRIVGGDAKL